MKSVSEFGLAGGKGSINICWLRGEKKVVMSLARPGALSKLADFRAVPIISAVAASSHRTQRGKWVGEFMTTVL